MRIQHNIMALNSNRQLGVNNSAVAKSLEKLSSGYKINRAGDDAAGLAISEKMRAQIKGLEAATDNSQDAISLVQTAEGGLQEVHSMLNRMTELATKSANGTYTDNVDRRALQDEIAALKDEVNRIADATDFNGIKLLDGSLVNENVASLQFGAGKYAASAGAEYTGKIQMVTDKTANPGIKVTITPDANAADATLKIELGSKDATKYSVSDIENAVKTAAQAYLDANPTAATALQDQAKSLLSFRLEGNDMDLAALADIDSTSVATGATVGANGVLTLQIGDTNKNYNQLSLGIADMHANALGIGGIDISNLGGAQDAIDKIKTAINTVSTSRGKLGAIQNRLEHTINNLGVTTENITSAESRIRDVDMAKEMMNYTKNSVLVQSAQAMLAQANQQPQSILQLLQ